MTHKKSRHRVITLLVIAACGLPSATAQQRSNPELLTLINKIQAIDNHCHNLPAADPKHSDSDSIPPDPLGKSPNFFDARQRENHPRWVEAWRALYGYTRQDLSPENVGELFKTKQRLMRDKALNYPAWVLDQAGIEIALVNAPQLGFGQTSPRFRWVPLADGFLFPFEYKDPTGNVQRRRKEINLDKPPASLTDYLDQVVKRQLQQWKSNGALAIKFQIAYYRSLTSPMSKKPMQRQSMIGMCRMVYRRQRSTKCFRISSFVTLRVKPVAWA